MMQFANLTECNSNALKETPISQNRICAQCYNFLDIYSSQNRYIWQSSLQRVVLAWSAINRGDHSSYCWYDGGQQLRRRFWVISRQLLIYSWTQLQSILKIISSEAIRRQIRNVHSCCSWSISKLHQFWSLLRCQLKGSCIVLRAGYYVLKTPFKPTSPFNSGYLKIAYEVEKIDPKCALYGGSINTRPWKISENQSIKRILGFDFYDNW